MITIIFIGDTVPHRENQNRITKLIYFFLFKYSKDIKLLMISLPLINILAMY